MISRNISRLVSQVITESRGSIGPNDETSIIVTCECGTIYGYRPYEQGVCPECSTTHIMNAPNDGTGMLCRD